MARKKLFDSVDQKFDPGASGMSATDAQAGILEAYNSAVTHIADTVPHVTTDQNDALDGATTPSASNVFATAEDLFNNPSGGIALEYVWSTDNTVSDPGAGNIKADNDDLTLATELYVSDLTSAGNSADPAWLSWREGDYVAVADKKRSDKGNSFKVNGAIIDNSTWFVVPVLPLATTGTPSISNGRNTVVNMVANPNSRMPQGGTANQILSKIDSTDYNTEWRNETGGGGGVPEAPANDLSYFRNGSVGGGAADWSTELKGYGETANALGNVSGTTASIAVADGNVVTANATGAWTITAFATTQLSTSFSMFLSTTGAHAITWPASVNWGDAGEPTIDANKTHLLSFFTTDTGSTFLGVLANKY